MTNSVLDRRLVERRSSTSKLIEIEGQLIQLLRPADTVSDGVGSRVRASEIPHELEPRKRCLFGLTQTGRGVNQMPERWFTTSTGEREQIVYVLIGLWDDDIRKDDWWIDAQGDKCKIIYVHHDRSYQTKAEVVVVAAGE